MTRQIINRGSFPGDASGEILYDAFGKVNTNSAELYSGRAAFRTFAAADATPSVLDGVNFKTVDATTITDFDDGYDGQQITVLIVVDTVIDFTSSGLIGNNGVNWNAAAGDSMSCVYDGTDWYCEVEPRARAIDVERDYGLVPNDTSAAAANIIALNAALAALVTSGGVLEFGNGETYWVDNNTAGNFARISQAAKFVINGNGSTIKSLEAPTSTSPAAGTNVLIFDRCSNFSVHDLTVDGNRDNRISLTGQYYNSVTAHNIELINCLDFSFHDVVSKESVIDPLTINAVDNTDTATYTKRGTFYNCTFNRGTRNNCSIINAYDLTFNECHFDDVDMQQTSGSVWSDPGMGVDIESNSGPAIPSNKNIKFNNCTFVDNDSLGFRVSGIGAPEDITLDNCVLVNNGLNSSANEVGTLYVLGGKNTKILNSLIDTSNLSTGTHMKVNAADSVTFGENRIVTAGGLLLEVGNSSDLAVFEDNAVEGHVGTDYLIHLLSSNNQIMNNRIVSGTDAVNAPSPIRVDADTQEISGNNIDWTGITGGAPNAIWSNGRSNLQIKLNTIKMSAGDRGIICTAGADNINMVGNDIDGAVILRGDLCHVGDNVIRNNDMSFEGGDNSIVGNTVYDGDITIAATADTNFVDGNRVEGTGNTVTIASGATGNVVTNNATTAVISDSGTSTVTTSQNHTL